MEFKIEITTGVSCSNPLDDFNPGKGLDIVGIVREELKEPNFPVRDIAVENVCTWKKDNYCVIDEDSKICVASSITAPVVERKVIECVSQFDASSIIKVYVPAGYLGRYHKMEIIKRYTNRPEFEGLLHLVSGFYFYNLYRYKRSINTVLVSYEFDQEAFITDWIKDGAPTYWNCDAKDIEQQQRVYDDRCDDIKAEKEKVKQHQQDEKDALARDMTRLRLKEYAEDLGTMQERLNSIIEAYQITIHSNIDGHHS